MEKQIFADTVKRWRDGQSVGRTAEIKIAAVMRTARAQGRCANNIKKSAGREVKQWLAGVKRNLQRNNFHIEGGPNIASAVKSGMETAMFDGYCDFDRLLEKMARARALADVDGVMPTEALEWLETYTPELAGVYSQDILDSVNEIISRALTTGLTEQSSAFLLMELNNVVSTFADARLDCIARTESVRAYNMGNLYNSLTASEVTGYEFSAILDSRTSEICRAREGLKFSRGDMNLLFNTPPLHPNCRSILIPLFDTERTVNEYESITEDLPASIQRDSDIEAVKSVFLAASQNGFS